MFALEADLRRRWPVFSDLLLVGTPFRAVVALPLQPALAGAGELDLFFEWEAVGRVGVELGIDTPSALSRLRACAFDSNRSVDDVAADLLGGRLRTQDLPRPDRAG